MKSNFKPLGDFIHLVDNRNKDGSVERLLGINITKNFMPSVANVSGTDLSKYKVINKGQFAYSSMQVGRDETVRVVLFTENAPAIISPAYLVFEVIDENIMLPEFLMMWFQRPESDRYGWFISDSSVRASLDWTRFCEIGIPDLDINEQRKYVAMYNAILSNQRCYEESLSDLRLICDSFMNSLKDHTKKDPLKEHLQLVDNRNSQDEPFELLGINVKKEFMPSKANVASSNLSKYKIIKKGQFAYSSMQVGRDETVRVALFDDNTPVIISPAYQVFEVINPDLVLPEYLMMWFKRGEFNRYGWFLSDSSVRASLDWSRFCEIEIPIPSIDIQKSIAAIYHVLEARKAINEKLKASIKPLCPILMRGVVQQLEQNATEAA